jgi:hypothetical protein
MAMRKMRNADPSPECIDYVIENVTLEANDMYGRGFSNEAEPFRLNLVGKFPRISGFRNAMLRDYLPCIFCHLSLRTA